MYKMTIYIKPEVRDKLYEIQFESVKEGKKKSFGQIIEELLKQSEQDKE